MTPVHGIARFRAYDALLLTSAIWFLAKFTRYALPPLFGTFQADYGVSTATLGLLFTLLMLVYAGMQFPSGALADRLGPVRVVTAGVAVLGVATLGLAATQAFAALVAAMVLIGLGTGVHKTVAINLVARAYPARVGRTLGVMDAIGELGGVGAPAAVVALLSAGIGWSTLFLGVGLAAVGLAAAFPRWVPRRLPAEPAAADADPTRSDGPVGVAGYLSVLRAPRTAGFVVVVVAYSFAFNGIVAFLPLFLEVEKGLPTATAGLLYAVLFGVSLVQPVTGGLADRFGRFPLMVVTLGLGSLALVGLLVASPVGHLALVVAVFGIGGHGFRPIREAHFMAVLPAGAAGGSLGLVRTVMMGAGAVAPAVVGVLVEVTSYGHAFGLLGLVLGLGTLLVVGLGLVDAGWTAQAA